MKNNKMLDELKELIKKYILEVRKNNGYIGLKAQLYLGKVFGCALSNNISYKKLLKLEKEVIEKEKFDDEQ